MPSSEIEKRKVQGLVGDLSFSVVLPKKFAVNLGIARGDYVDVTLEDKRIVIEKSA